MTSDPRPASKAGVIAGIVALLAAVYVTGFVPAYGWLAGGDPFATPKSLRVYRYANSAYEDQRGEWLVRLYEPMFELCDRYPELDHFVARHGTGIYWSLTKP